MRSRLERDAPDRYRRRPACRRSPRAPVLGVLGLLALAPAGAQPARDTLTPELRAAVERLKAEVAARPTDASTIAARARVLADWADAYALAGGEVGLEGPAVRIFAALPPSGRAAAQDAADLDRLVREFILREDEGALGTLAAESLGPWPARAHGTVRQTWTVGTRGMKTGGGFWVARHFNANFGEYQTSDPRGEGYVTISSDDPDARFAVDSIMASGPHGGFRAPEPALFFRLDRGELEPGRKVTITYGDTSGGGAGLLMPTSSSARMPLPLYVDLDGSREWRPLPIQPFVITGTRATGVHGFAPSIVAPGESFELSVRAEDAFFNRATGAIPAFDVVLDGKVVASTPAGTEPITVLQLAIERPGPAWIELRSRDGAITGVANPILVEQDPQTRIWWGDTHGHSGYAEGIGTVEYYMTFARDDARLDYVTHSEHDSWLDAGEWELMRKTTAAFDAPGRFVPYLGWEWTRHARFGGHHNVLYRTVGDQQPVSGLEYPTLSELYAELHRRFPPDQVLIIPHAHNPGDYRYSDPKMQTLVEMMSMHGSFEWFMKAYLAHGHWIGVVAASDDHLSHPGYSAPSRDSLAQRGGLGAVLAKERTRDAIFDAMKERRTYATTGDRIILKLDVNGSGMGQRARFASSRHITGRVIGTAPIESIALIKNDRELWRREYSVDRAAARDGIYQLSFYSDPTPLHPGDAPRGWRHWRGKLTVEGARMESVTATDFYNPTTQMLEPEADGARFATHTRGDTSSLRLELAGVGADAALVLDLEEAKETGSAPPFFRPQAVIPGGRVRIPLADLREGRLDHKLPIEGYEDDGILVRRIVEDGPRDLELEHTDTTDPREGDYYYLRVQQLNDATAWSSPVWVGGYPPQ